MKLLNLKDVSSELLEGEYASSTRVVTRTGEDTSSASIKYFLIEGDINTDLVIRAQEFVNSLQSYDSVRLIVSSCGGSCSSALILTHMLLRLTNTIEVEFVGMNMSAALIFAKLGNLRVFPGAVIMAHPVSFVFNGSLGEVAKQFAASKFFGESSWHTWYDEALANLGFTAEQIERAKIEEVWITV